MTACLRYVRVTPRADIDRLVSQVRNGPIAATCSRTIGNSFRDHRIGTSEQCARYGKRTALWHADFG
jgi:hypothetical protein